jgi:tripartite-type tricarboxylate transporter receptor subunit TctC
MTARVLAAAAAAAGVLCAGGVTGQPYPAHAVRVVVAAAAGSDADPAARILAPRLAQRLGQPVVVDNRPAASGAIGAQYAARAAPDGYTVLLATAAELALHPALAGRPAYDVTRDFVPVALVSEVPLMLAVHPSLPVRSVPQLLALARSRPGQVRYGSGGNGTAAHVALALLGEMAGFDLVHVPYETLAAATADLVAGNVQVLMPRLPVVQQHVQHGRLRALGVSSAQRWPLAPEVPALAEAGVPGYQAVLWTGLAAPANTPAEIAERLHRELVQVLAQPEVVQRFAALGEIARPLGPAEFGAYIEAELRRWSELGKRSAIRSE